MKSRKLYQKYNNALNDLLKFVKSRQLGLSIITPEPSKVINGMVLGFLSEAKIKNIDEVIRRIIDYLLDERKILSSELWEDEHEEVIFKINGEIHTRPWTHFTTAWAIDGLILNKDYLHSEQKLKLLDSIILLLSFQKDDGYFYSTDIIKSSIFITALSVFALSKSIYFIQAEDWQEIIKNYL